MIVHTRTSLGFLTSSRGTIRLLHREPGHCVRHAPRLDPRAGHGGAAPERAAPRPEQGSGPISKIIKSNELFLYP